MSKKTIKQENTALKPIPNLGEFINYLAVLVESKTSEHAPIHKLRQFSDTDILDFELGNHPKDLLDLFFFNPLEERFLNAYQEMTIKTTASYYRDILDKVMNQYYDHLQNTDFSNHSRNGFILFFADRLTPLMLNFMKYRLNSYQSFLKELNYCELSLYEMLKDQNPIKYFLKWMTENLGFKHGWLNSNAKAQYDHILRWSAGENVPKRESIFEGAPKNQAESRLCLSSFIQQLSLNSLKKNKLLLLLEEFFFLARASMMILEDISQASLAYFEETQLKYDFKESILLYLKNSEQTPLFKLNSSSHLALSAVTSFLKEILIKNKEEITHQRGLIEQNLAFFKEALQKQPNRYDQINYHFFEGIYEIYTYQFKSGIENIECAYQLAIFTGHPYSISIFNILAALYSLQFLFDKKELNKLIDIRYAGLDNVEKNYTVTRLTKMQQLNIIYYTNHKPLEADKFLRSSLGRRSHSFILEDIDIYQYQNFFTELFYQGKFEKNKKYIVQINILYDYIRQNQIGIVEFDGNIAYDLKNPNKILIPSKKHHQAFVAIVQRKKHIFKELIKAGVNLNHLSTDNESILQFALQIIDPEEPLTGSKDPFWYNCLKNKSFKIETICAITSKKRHTPLEHAINTGKLEIVKDLFQIFLKNENAQEKLAMFCNQKFSVDETSALYKVIALIRRYKQIPNPFYPNEKQLSESIRRNHPKVQKLPVDAFNTEDFFDDTYSYQCKLAEENYQLNELRELAKFLLVNQANPSLNHSLNTLQKYTPFHMAIEADEVDLIRLMIEEYDVNYREKIWIKHLYLGYQHYGAIELAQHWHANQALKYFSTLSWS